MENFIFCAVIYVKNPHHRYLLRTILNVCCSILCTEISALSILFNLFFFMKPVIIIIMIIFVSKSVFHDYMSWTVSCESLLSISSLTQVFTDFPLFRISSDYLIPWFLRSSSGETITLTLKVLHFLDQLRHFFQMTKPLN